jgi:hypothetical protein
MIWRLKIVRKFARWVLKPRPVYDEATGMEPWMAEFLKELLKTQPPTRIFLTHADEDTGVRQMFREDEIQN